MKAHKPYHYSDNNDSVIIDSTDLPKDWSNYLWSEKGYIGRFTQAGHGESYHIDEMANLCELNSGKTRYIYFRDDESNICWNSGESPLMEKVEEYKCLHNIAYTRISSRKEAIRTSVRYFVPTSAYHEIWTINIINDSDKIRNLSIFSVVDFCLEGFNYPRYHEMFRTLHAGYQQELNGIFCKSGHHYAPHERYNAFLASSEKIVASDAHLKKFTGGTGSYARPKMLLSGGNCTNSRRTCYDTGAVLQNKVMLRPGESKEMHFIFGMTDSLKGAIHTIKDTFLPGKINALLNDTIENIRKKYSGISCQTPDVRINQLMNNWVKKQVDFCIVGKKGVRDNAQIASALLMYRPEKARQEILEILRHQYKSGNAVLTWLPLDETRYSDQPFWIVWSVTELIKETGDFSVLDEIVEYQDGGVGSVYEHLKAGINRLLEDRGKNGLVRIFFADWNDALNVLDDPEAESVMLTEQFCLALKEMVELTAKVGDKTYSDFLQEKYTGIKAVLNEKSWDGEWYVRALSEKGNIGSKSSSGSNIYLNPQVWALLSEIHDPTQEESILKAIDGMEHDFGFPINMPPYDFYTHHTGRMSLMAPGLFENGGVYCHASAFKVMMDGKMGRGDEALRTLRKIIPDSNLNPYHQSETEPYVFTNCYSTNPDAFGKADRSWITGTSAWCMKAIYEGILGVYKDYDGLRIAPALPKNWKSAMVKRVFRNCTYMIHFSKSGRLSGKVLVNGQDFIGIHLPVGNAGDSFNIEVFV